MEGYVTIESNIMQYARTAIHSVTNGFLLTKVHLDSRFVGKTSNFYV